MKANVRKRELDIMRKRINLKKLIVNEKQN